MLEQGFLGIILLFGFILAVCRAAYRSLPKDFWWCSLTICLTIMTLVHNSTESSFLKTSNFLWSLLVILYLLVSVPQKLARPAVQSVPGIPRPEPAPEGT
jgi:hypothetical protein